MIHLYKFKEINILLDVNSGAVHIVSDIVYDILLLFVSKTDQEVDLSSPWQHAKQEIQNQLIEKYSSSELNTATKEIDLLISEGTLFASETPKEITSPENRGAVIKALCLHVAHDCNMRCAYCFADTGGFSGKRSLLPLETGKKAIDFLIEHSGSRHNLEVDFFGGEPLMNFDVVKELVSYGKENEAGKNIRFTITTNGLLLDEEKEDFINKYMDNVVLSIDGRPEVNDKMRKTVSGDGTYKHIINNLTRFRDNREGLYYVRGTFTSFNKDFAEDVKHLAELGFENISVEPVVTDENHKYALTKKDVPEILDEYDRLTDLIIEADKDGKPISFFHFNIDLAQGPCIFKRAIGCGAGTEYIAVSPDGDIYPCHQFVGEDEYILGNVNDKHFENKLFDKFNTAHIYNKKECSACWAKYYCSGGCHANAFHSNNDFLKPHELSCIFEKKRIECAIGILALNAN